MLHDLFRTLLITTLISTFQALSVVPIQPGITVHGDMQGESLVNYYALNVTGSTSTTRMTVLLRQIGGGRDSGLVLSVCFEKLPCGDLGCGCPQRFVDPPPSLSKESNRRSSTDPSSELRVDVSPCDLMDGLWYISVELSIEEGDERARATAFYDLTATLDNAQLVLGQVQCVN